MMISGLDNSKPNSTADLISTSRSTEVKNHPTSLGVTCNQHAEFSAHVGLSLKINFLVMLCCHRSHTWPKRFKRYDDWAATLADITTTNLSWFYMGTDTYNGWYFHPHEFFPWQDLRSSCIKRGHVWERNTLSLTKSSLLRTNDQCCVRMRSATS